LIPAIWMTVFLERLVGAKETETKPLHPWNSDGYSTFTSRSCCGIRLACPPFLFLIALKTYTKQGRSLVQSSAVVHPNPDFLGE